MATPAEGNKPPAPTAPESPTTARPLEMDDDDVQESGIVTDDGTTHYPARTTSIGTSDAPPAKPPRPATEQQKNEMILKEAFPSVDITVIKAVLSASGGRVEPAFHALLEMTDPDAVKSDPQEMPPPQPPRPAGGNTLTQLEADELYARQLAEHYENVGAYEERTRNRPSGGHRQHRDTGPKPSQTADDREHSFLDDDLPVIRENLRKGFVETQTKVNGWISQLRKKIDDVLDEREDEEQRPVQAQQGRRPGDNSRRSGDYERYDADPQVITDDFAGMKFASDGSAVREDRPPANPALFKPPPPSKSPRSAEGRRVAFKEGNEEADVYDSSPRLPAKDAAPSSGNKTSKWQPLSTIEPSPVAENDPFSLGDSEDEKEARKEIKMEDKDSERLRKAAAEAMNDSLVDSKPGAAGAVSK